MKKSSMNYCRYSLLLSNFGKISFLKFTTFFLFLLVVLCNCRNIITGQIMEFKEEQKKLTLMIYMAADNDLESEAIANLKQMEHSNFDKMNVLVLLDRAEDYDRTNGDWSDTRLYKIAHDRTNGNYIISERLDCPILGLNKNEQTELDMANFSVLRNFITFAKNEYKAEKYALIIWGHGTGWRYSYHEGTRAVAVDEKTNTYMTVLDEGKAVRDMDLAVIGFDTCFGGTIENLYELKESAAYTVASPSVTPSLGWNYTELLENLSQSNFSNSEIAKIMAESSSVKTSVYDNGKLNDVFNCLESFAEALSSSIISNEIRLEVLNKLLSAKSYSFFSFPSDMFLDMYSMAEQFATSVNGSVAQSAQNLMTAIKAAGNTTNSQCLLMGIYFIEKNSSQTLATQHPSGYMKNQNNITQCSFIKDSVWWVPTISQNTNSLLDTLFYKVY